MILELSDLFARYPAASRPISPLESLGNAGGMSGSSLFRYQSARGPMVARCWPLDGPDSSRLARIHDWLRELESLPFVAQPRKTLDGETSVSLRTRLWEVGPWMKGEADLGRPPGPERLRGIFAGLALVLGRLVSGRFAGPSPGLRSRADEIERLLLGGFEAIRSAVRGREDDPASKLVGEWLVRAAEVAPQLLESTEKAASRPLPLQPCLRDARPEHFLFDGDQLVGLVDFGAMDIDTVAGDLARMLAETVGPDRSSRRDALAAFEAIYPLTDKELRSIEAFQLANAWLGPARWARWHFLEGRTFERPEVVVERLRLGIRRIDELRGSIDLDLQSPVFNRSSPSNSRS